MAQMKTGEELLQQQGQVVQQNVYVPSQTVTEANTQLAEISAGKPADYTNQHADALGGLYDQILNRGQFNWNMATDPAYQAYRQQYQQMGQQGMQQSKQNISALGGGYGNTFGNAVASQQYGEHLKAMDDILPAMEQNAYGAYQAEGARLGTQLAATAQQEQTEYGRWADTYSNWANDRAFAQQRAQTEYANDYSRYADNMNNVMQVLGFERQDAQIVQQNAKTWAQNLLAKGIMPTEEILNAAGIDVALAKKIAKKHGWKGKGGSGGHSGNGGGAGTGTGAAGEHTTKDHYTIADGTPQIKGPKG